MTYPYSMTYTVSPGDTILAGHLNVSNNEHINNNTPETIDDYSATVNEMGSISDPYPSGAESQPTTLDGELRAFRYQIYSLIAKFNVSATKWYHDVTNESMLLVKGADVVSAAALPVINDGAIVDVTGTTTITSINSVGIGTTKLLQFDDVLTITHHSTDLILPGAVNITTVAGDIGMFYEYTTGKWVLISWLGKNLRPAVGEKKILQRVRTEVTDYLQNATTIPFDNSLPQNTEGSEYMTANITPLSVGSKLKVRVLGHFGANGGGVSVTVAMALFRGAGVNAGSVVAATINDPSDLYGLYLEYEMTTGALAQLTFSVRAGANSGTTYFNGSNGNRKYGFGLISFIEFTEYEA